MHATQSERDRELPRPWPYDHIDEVYRYAYAMLRQREDAEDVAIETVTDAVVGSKRLSSVLNPGVYLFGIARRKVINRLRARRKPAPPPSEPVIEPNVDLGLVLEKLAPDHAEALVLKYMHGMTTEEVAKVIGKSAKATNSLLQRARAAFRELGSDILEEESNS